MGKEVIYITKDICSTTGANERTSVKLIASVNTGETHLEIQKTITERYTLKEYDKVMKLYEKLNKSGRIIHILKDL